MTASTVVASPIGPLALTARDGHLVRLAFAPDAAPDTAAPVDAVLRRAAEQLDAYFAGELQTFNLPLAPGGAGFQRAVWDALARIPYGTTTSYGALARRLGRPEASRAVGAANARNPIAVVLPCHRVIGADGGLTGFGGGLETKRRLLVHEGVLLA